MPRTLSAKPLADAGDQVAVLAPRWYPQIMDGLIDGALQALAEGGIADHNIMLCRCPGAMELPLLAEELATGGQHDALVALGCVIRGQTDHYQHVCHQCLGGLERVARQHRLALGLGVLTADNMELAEARATGDNNRGRDAARAALEMAAMLRLLRQGGIS